LKNKLARVGETVSDDTILMQLVTGLRDKYFPSRTHGMSPP
jgi:hypothetical protein